jgi:ATP-dependent exoDNAse (exonuclease V) beta subunit
MPPLSEFNPSPPNVLSFVTSAPDDTTARAAALDPRASCIVEAPAGSGKTGLLVQRFLKLLGDDTVEQPEEVLAMTFTRKATAEMQERVLEQLQSAHDSTPLPDDSAFEQQLRTLALAALARSERLGWNLLAQPQRLNIRSILSVCMSLANAQPLLSGMGGVQQPVDDPMPLYRTAARRTLMQLGGPDAALNNALTNVLLHRDGSLANCETLIASMLQTREQWAEIVPLDRTLDDAALDALVRPKLERSLEQIVCRGLTRAVEAMPPGLFHELTTLAARLGLQPGYKGADSPIAICAGRHEPPAAAAEHLEHWRALIFLLLKPSDHQWRAGFASNHLRIELEKPDATYLKQLVQSIQSDPLQAALSAVLSLPPAKYPDEQWLVARSLFHVLRHALAELKLLFAERGICDFNELSLAARSTVGVTDLALAAGGQLRHLLVDELQDTSSPQYDLIELLTRSWDGHSQTLLLVGDPKQSIYLFRQARVERFLRTMHEATLGDIPLQPLRLTANFRSQAALVTDFNTTFDRIFPSPDELTSPGDVPFLHATAKRDLTSNDGILWHPTILEADNPIHYNQLEAAEIRRLIDARLAMDLPEGRTKPWSIAVLARAKHHLDAVVTELKAHDGKPEIPFHAIDLDALSDRPEVLDALALTRALLHPADRIAWLAVLRAPWCGLSRADLLTLTGDAPDPGAPPSPTAPSSAKVGPLPIADPHTSIATLIRSRASLLSPDAQQRLTRAWPILETYLATLGRTSLPIHIERTWRSLGGDAPLTPEQQANVLRYFDLLAELQSEPGGITVSTINQRMAGLFAAPSHATAQVELLTIHSAKGLEWDLVLVPGLHRRPRSSNTQLLNWVELDGDAHNDASIILAPIWGRGETSDRLNDWLKSIRTARERAELKRLFYVAATRAREELHLFAALERKTSGELKQPAASTLLSACWPAAQPHFETSQAQPPTILTFPSQTHADEYEPTLALAASAAEPAPQIIQRLPLDFDPLTRFTATPRLAYPDASTLRRSDPFDRPEGGFAARAFGNVVHRYLQLLADRLVTNPNPGGPSVPLHGTGGSEHTHPTLLAELPTWLPRLTASLRSEGLAPTAASREATRALDALTRTLTDPTGRWILTPHPAATSEQALSTPQGSLRADRTFLAGPTPGSTGNDHLWIIDFKTTEQGSRTDDAFAASETQKYRPQLEAYAKLRRTLPHILSSGDLPIHLALYYPLIPKLISWQSPGS